MSSTTKTPSSRPYRRGSDFSDRQIAFSVRYGRRVQVTLPTGSLVVGWIFGSDDYHWGLVDTEGRMHMVHKTCPRVTIETEFTLDSLPEDLRAEIDSVVRPFREHVMRTHFSTTNSLPHN